MKTKHISKDHDLKKSKPEFKVRLRKHHKKSPVKYFLFIFGVLAFVSIVLSKSYKPEPKLKQNINQINSTEHAIIDSTEFVFDLSKARDLNYNLRLLKSQKPEERIQALGNLYNHVKNSNYKQIINILINTLKTDSDSFVRERAALYLSVFITNVSVPNQIKKDKQVINALIQALKNDNSEGVRYIAASSLLDFLSRVNDLYVKLVLLQASEQDASEKIRGYLSTNSAKFHLINFLEIKRPHKPLRKPIEFLK